MKLKETKENNILEQKEISNWDKPLSRPNKCSENEINILRRESALRESNFQTERSGYLSRIELISLENNELKMRQLNLMQVNQALTEALKGKDGNNELDYRQYIEKIKQLENKLEERENSIKSLSKQIEDLSKLREQTYILKEDTVKLRNEANKLEQELTELKAKQEKIEQENDRKAIETMKDVTNIIADFEYSEQLLKKISERYKVEIPCTKKVIKITKPEKNSSFIKNEEISWFQNRGTDKTRSEILHSVRLSRSILQNKTARKLEIQTDKLLCEICRKVYSHQDFINHLNNCQQDIFLSTLPTNYHHNHRGIKKETNEEKRNNNSFNEMIVNQNENKIKANKNNFNNFSLNYTKNNAKNKLLERNISNSDILETNFERNDLSISERGQKIRRNRESEEELYRIVNMLNQAANNEKNLSLNFF